MLSSLMGKLGKLFVYSFSNSECVFAFFIKFICPDRLIYADIALGAVFSHITGQKAFVIVVFLALTVAVNMVQYLRYLPGYSIGCRSPADKERWRHGRPGFSAFDGGQICYILRIIAAEIRRYPVAAAKANNQDRK